MFELDKLRVTIEDDLMQTQIIRILKMISSSRGKNEIIYIYVFLVIHFWYASKFTLGWCKFSLANGPRLSCNGATFSAVELTRKISDILMRAQQFALHYDLRICKPTAVDRNFLYFRARRFVVPIDPRNTCVKEGRGEDVRFELQSGMRPSSISELTSALSYLKGNSRATD